ncbi:NADH dehydrogenase [Sinobacterium norvegicum]|uniref:NADH dehydrogenase n=1 Tax=Sinobacterium norvegicum TaxID=1641715 RepID=A0ABM9ABK1_9GAMM|nr:NAD(P)/FAD-dependent oxidoreductase [Sinobacterium norvegicum]CAH0990585.1 NADH dehydrogenase [Sinobacterium norvegicum]
MKKILIVGGGAGGLPLATFLGKKLGKKGRASITLVDSNHSHIWKPRFHEVATGSLDTDLDAISYRAHAKVNHYNFELGTMTAIDRDNKTVQLSAIDDDSGGEILPARQLDYDYLCITVGSRSNDFGVGGVQQHCYFLDSSAQADRFRTQFLNNCLSANHSQKPLSISILGGGATGVELAAEIHHAIDLLKLYGHDELDRSRLDVKLIEAGERLLPALKERISYAARAQLEAMGVKVHTSTAVTSVTEQGFNTKDGVIKGDILVWAAGILAPKFLSEIAGLESNRINQLLVKPTLQTTNDDTIFAFGDCCSCPDENGKPIAPRAQAAQQMAKHTAKNIVNLINDKPLTSFKYNDKGSLVSLSKFASVGYMMGNLRGSNFFVEGWLARVMYIGLYRLHQAALFGWPKTIMLLTAGRFNSLVRPKLKLH